MTDDKPPPSLDDLDAKLRQARTQRPVESATEASDNVSPGLGFALRIGIELVAALAVGVGIGLLLDRWLGTTPWMMVVFFFLGSAAGFLNVYRAASKYGYGVDYRPEKDRTQQQTPSDGDKESK